MERFYITELQIMNVRHLKDICIPLSKDKIKHLILTGKNGSGKTSVLEYLNRYFMNRERYQVAGVTPFSDRCGSFCWTDGREAKGKPTDRFWYGEAAFELCKMNLRNYRTRKDYENGIKQNLVFQKKTGIRLFRKVEFFCILWSREKNSKPEKPKHVEKVELKGSYGTTGGPAMSLFKYLLDLNMMEALAIANGKQEKAEEIKIWFLQFEKLLQQIFSDTRASSGF